MHRKCPKHQGAQLREDLQQSRPIQSLRLCPNALETELESHLLQLWKAWLGPGKHHSYITFNEKKLCREPTHFRPQMSWNNFLLDPKVTNFRLDEKKQTAHIQDKAGTTLRFPCSCLYAAAVNLWDTRFPSSNQDHPIKDILKFPSEFKCIGKKKNRPK